MKVRDIMTVDPACCTPDTKLVEVACMMVDNDCGQIPVVESAGSRKPVGVVTDRDLIVRAIARGKNPLDMTTREVMSSPAITVTDEASIEECCRILEDRQIRRLPVVDHRGACCGMVSQADLALNAPEQTAEVVKMVSQPVHA